MTPSNCPLRCMSALGREALQAWPTNPGGSALDCWRAERTPRPPRTPWPRGPQAEPAPCVSGRRPLSASVSLWKRAKGPPSPFVTGCKRNQLDQTASSGARGGSGGGATRGQLVKQFLPPGSAFISLPFDRDECRTTTSLSSHLQDQRVTALHRPVPCEGTGV